jgi:hypothetical protein
MLRPSTDCPTCDRACERNALLVHLLKKMVARIHRLHHGEPEHSWLCSHPECKAAWEAIG